MINRAGVVLHSHLDTAGEIEFVGVDLGLESVLDALHQDAFGVFGREETAVAENVHIVGQFFGCHHRNHLIDNEIHIF